MNSDEIWLLQLWSGVFGAAIGAVAAAAVALIVVSLTNRHQTRLSAKATVVQKKIAEDALREQRQQADKALRAQEDGLRRQLVEQQSQASMDRQRSAIAEMVSCALELVDRADETLNVIMVLRHRMSTAWIRFSMERPGGAEDGSDEFFHWPSHLTSLAMDVLHARLAKEPKENAFDLLNDATSTFATLARHWLRAGTKSRLVISKLMTNVRLNPTAERTEEDFFSPIESLE